MVRRSGADSIELRYCDGHDEPADDDEPVTVVWMAIAHWPERVTDAASAVPGAIMPEHFDACAGMTPWRAIFRLCEASMDGGVCLHCGRPTAIDDKPADEFLAATEDFVLLVSLRPRAGHLPAHVRGLRRVSDDELRAVGAQRPARPRPGPPAAHLPALPAVRLRPAPLRHLRAGRSVVELLDRLEVLADS